LSNTFEANGNDWGIGVESFCTETRLKDRLVLITTMIPLKNCYTSKKAKNVLLYLKTENCHQKISSNTCGCILANTIQFYQNATTKISMILALTRDPITFTDGWATTLVIYNIF
jgi:excinuclease UvrABC nuclease subunit